VSSSVNVLKLLSQIFHRDTTAQNLEHTYFASAKQQKKKYHTYAHDHDHMNRFGIKLLPELLNTRKLIYDINNIISLEMKLKI
jgi:hypothetical protein